MEPQGLHISVIEPIGPAIERVKVILFKPFDIGRWFTIGFCAWLAYLGTAGGGPWFNRPSRHYGHGEHSFDQVKCFVVDNLAWLIPVVVVVAIVVILLWLVILWLRCRGEFMFLHCVASNVAQVKVPWMKFRQHGNSLFLFRIVLGLIGFVAVGLPCLVAIFLICAVVFGSNLNIVPLAGSVMIFLTVLVISILFLLVRKFTADFVVPIMLLRTTSCVTAWRDLLPLLAANKGKFALYILFQIVITMAISAIIMALVLATCCCAACFLAIPYIGTVLVLPLAVFKRAYSLYYLRQFGTGFDCFALQATTGV